MRRRNREKSETTYDPTRRKKRYSNFHRARKWHRKFRNVLYDPRGVRLWLVHHYADLHEKYYLKATRTDGVVIDHVGKADQGKLIIVKHHGPTSELVAEWKVVFASEHKDRGGSVASPSEHQSDDNLSKTLE